MKTLKPIFILLLLLPLLLPLHAADVVMLKDGHGFTGQIVSIKHDVIKMKWQDDKLFIPLEDIEQIEFESPGSKLALEFMTPQGQGEKCIAAQQDAEMYHGKVGGHVVLGFFFGPFALIGTALAQPYPHRGRHTPIMSKNKDLFDDPEFALCYKRIAKGKLLGAEAIGWGAWLVIFLIASSSG